MAKQTFIPSTIYQISYMSFTIPVMTRKIGIESTISQMIPPKNILINTGTNEWFGSDWYLRDEGIFG